MIDVGDALPDFKLQNQDGETVRKKDLHGKKVVLFAYPKANTPGCTTQACGLRDQTPQFNTAGAVVVGLSPDKPEALAKWKAKESLPYDLLSDPDHGLLEALGAWGEKSMYGRKYMGVIRSHWIVGEDGKILDAQIKVSPKKSVELATKFLAAAS